MSANVQSVDALISWQGDLSVFRSEAGEALSSVLIEVRKAFDWLETELERWKKDKRDAEDLVFQAKMELRRKQIPDFNGRLPDTTVEEKNLAKAEAWLEYCEERIAKCRYWIVELPRWVEGEYAAPTRKLNHFIESELTRTQADLDYRIRTLQEYLQIQSGGQ